MVSQGARPRPLTTLEPRPIPLPLAAGVVPLPLPATLPVAVYREVVEDAGPPLVLRVRLTPFGGAAAAAARFLSSSSAFRCASSLRLCSSACLRSASACRLFSSFSISSISCVAPCHCGFRSKRWLCSVWLRIRVQVARRVEALLTVWCTVPMFALAFSSDALTPSITLLTSRTRSSSACRRASRASSASWRFSARAGLLDGASSLGVCFCVVAPLSGLANRSSSLSSCRRRRAMSVASVDLDIFEQGGSGFVLNASFRVFGYRLWVG
jgi:hypothetical protein